jgi:hypothetical protein
VVRSNFSWQLKPSENRLCKFLQVSAFSAVFGGDLTEFCKKKCCKLNFCVTLLSKAILDFDTNRHLYVLTVIYGPNF